MRALLVPIALFLLVAAPASAVRTAAEHSCLTSLSRPAGRTSRQDVKSRALLLSLRGGAAAETNKPANDEKKKSPFGLPALIGPTLYGHMDCVPFIMYFAYFAHVLEGTASNVYASVGIFHTLHSLATDYDGKGSWFQRLLGVNIAVPMWTMYWFDVIISGIFIVLPSYIDGYTDETTTLVVRAAALGGLLFYFPFAESGSVKN